MTQRQLTRFRSQRIDGSLSKWWHGHQDRWGLALTASACLATMAVLILSVSMWVNAYVESEKASLGTGAIQKTIKIFDFATPWQVPSFSRGTEIQVKEFLEKNPLTTHLVSRRGPTRIWERRSNGLELMTPSPQRDQIERWALAAMVEGQSDWTPPTEMDPEQDQISTLLFVAKDWIKIDRIRPGSRELELFFQRELGPFPPLRIGIYSKKAIQMQANPKAAWGAEPNIQVDYPRIQESPISTVVMSTAFKPTWEVKVIPREHKLNEVRKGIRHRWYMGISGTLFILGFIVLGFWIRHRTYRKAQLESDRLAALAHSLKTPLAIHKFRCDAIRLNLLPPDEIAEELIRLGTEVDRFTQLIEQGLTSTRQQRRYASAEITPQWIEAIADDLVPAFERKHRRLCLSLAQDLGYASLPFLRAGLQTLLENALHHGAGNVTLGTSRQGKRLVISVRDEGPGMDALQLRAIGKPFMRIRVPGREGFSCQGNGLGLTLLAQVAGNEGWGLSFSSVRGKGFTAMLMIHLADRNSSQTP